MLDLDAVLLLKRGEHFLAQMLVPDAAIARHGERLGLRQRRTGNQGENGRGDAKFEHEVPPELTPGRKLRSCLARRQPKRTPYRPWPTAIAATSARACCDADARPVHPEC